ncbi:MAG: HAD-IA family hydrolase [Candidatus Moraniibacteriota bacterium]|nr:MAG: HAD-IA family hydrolase [Candidatus Moranbacteria bacterium]
MNKTVIFDLDGTLVDIEPVFLRIYNTLAAEFGLAPIRPDELPALRKLHLKQVMFRRLGWRIVFLPRILKRGQTEYRLLVPEVELFPGIQETLTHLRAFGYRIGIISSSERTTVLALIEKFGLDIDFVYQSSLFGKAAILKETAEKESFALADTVYIGDEIRDIDACRKAGLDIIAVTWGLNDRSALIATGAPTADTPAELEAKILALLPLSHSLKSQR